MSQNVYPTAVRSPAYSNQDLLDTENIDLYHFQISREQMRVPIFSPDVARVLQL